MHKADMGQIALASVKGDHFELRRRALGVESGGTPQNGAECDCPSDDGCD
jgi:hypothetical protein